MTWTTSTRRDSTKSAMNAGKSPARHQLGERPYLVGVRDDLGQPPVGRRLGRYERGPKTVPVEAAEPVDRPLVGPAEVHPGGQIEDVDAPALHVSSGLAGRDVSRARSGTGARRAFRSMARVLLSERRRLPDDLRAAAAIHRGDAVRAALDPRLRGRRGRRLDPGARVADVGAGNAPYRELFEHADYVTIDWEQSIHEEAQRSDIIASAESIPVATRASTASCSPRCWSTCRRRTRCCARCTGCCVRAGRSRVTVPLAWELHELPHDYFRFTARGLEMSLERAGLRGDPGEARNDCFTTLAQLMQNVRWSMGRRRTASTTSARPPARSWASSPCSSWDSRRSTWLSAPARLRGHRHASGGRGRAA